MLHIHNGDSSADIARQSTLPGEHFAWREALIEGPTPAGIAEPDWRNLRARHLTEFYGVDPAETESGLRVQEDKLASYPEHDEVILWFEHDLFCQINLLYLLNWFAEHNLANTRLSLICIGEFPELPNFRGLGELNPEQMASLFDTRHEVSNAEKTLSSAAWQAYCSPDPTAIQTLLETDTSAMPFLKRALQLHLERFPFVSNGIGRIENRALEFIREGVQTFIDLFSRFGDAEPTYGLGDAQFWNTLRRMCEAPKPLLNIKNGNASGPLSSENFNQMSFEITEAGDAVLNAQADFVEINGIETWLGGVHLLGKDNVWRWDSQKECLIYSPSESD
ncbi:MAG: hypothetical protein ND866_17905 [Pyrinomonadaceae bacterium]|nr:hypothetical protein [Pyrinomonadaceae bacterium]